MHHMYLLVENCFSSGKITAMTRHGMAKRSQAPLVRASFEETSEVLFEASLFGIKDPISGVSESIMLGQKTKCGTGFAELSYDPSIVPPIVSHNLLVEPMLSVDDIIENHNIEVKSEDSDGNSEGSNNEPMNYIGRKRQRSVTDTSFVQVLPQSIDEGESMVPEENFLMLTPSMF